MAKPVKILLVDDDADDRIIFGEALEIEKCNAVVVEIPNGQLAIDMLSVSEATPDFVVMDVNMPEVNGIDCTRWIRSEERFDSVPVVMLSTSNTAQNVQACREAGASLYFEKPVQFQDLRRLVRDLALQNWEELSSSPTNLLAQNL